LILFYVTFFSVL